MKKLALIVSISMVALTASTANAADSVTLKYGGFGSGKSPFYTFGVKPYVKRVAEASKGAAKVQIYVNTLGGATELYENTKNGLADIAWIIAGAQRGFKFPRSEVLSLPFVLEGHSNAHGSVALWNLYKKGLVAADFSDVVPIAFASMSPGHVITKDKSPTLRQLRGMKFGVTSGVTARTAKALGAIPVFTPVTNLYQSMNRGTVDGLLVGFTAVKFFRLDEVTNRHLVMPLDTPMVFIGMNKKKLDSLSATTRAVVLGEAGAKLSGALGTASDRMVGFNRKALTKDPKQKVVDLAEKKREAWRSRLRPLVDQWVKSTPNGAAILAAYRAELNRLKGSN